MGIHHSQLENIPANRITGLNTSTENVAIFYEYRQFQALTPMEFLHGLGGMPDFYRFNLYCHTHDVWWSVGWYVPLSVPCNEVGLHHIDINYGVNSDRLVFHHWAGSSLALKRTDYNDLAYITPSRWGINCTAYKFL